MACEEIQVATLNADERGANGQSLFKTSLSAKALVRKAEYRVACGLPRRLTDTALAEEVGVSVEALRSAFAHVYGASIYRSLLTLRVQLVDRALEINADLNPRSIAEVCGFGYFGRFHQLYRRATGRSPGPNQRYAVSKPEGLRDARAALAETVDRYFSEQRA